MLRSSGARVVAGAFAASAVLTALVFFTPPSVLDSMDYHRFHEPMHVFTARALRAGHLPLWNPHVNLGRPHLADLQAGVFHPTSLLYLLTPLPVAFALAAFLHFALGVIGLVKLAGHVGARAGAAFPVALAVFFGGSVASTLQTGSIECIEAVAYLPWLFLFAVRMQEQPAGRWLALGALTLALQLLCGHPQYTWLTVVGAGLFLLGRRLQWPVRSTSWRGMLLDAAWLAVMGGWALAIDGAQTLPFLELARQGNRAEATPAFASSFSMPWADWASLVRPVSASFLVNWVDNLYPGIWLTLAGLAGLTRVRDRNVRGLLAVCLVSLLVAAGDRTPAFAVLYHLLPGVSMFRLHARMAVLIVLALALAAALVLSRPAALPRLLPLVAATVLAAGAVIAVELRVAASARSWPAVAVQLALILSAGALTAQWLRRGRPAIAAALVILALVDGARATVQLKRVYQAAPYFPAEQAMTGALQAQLLPGAPPPRVSMPYPYARENAGMIFGYGTFTGYVSLTGNRVWSYLHGSLGLRAPALLNTVPSNEIYRFGPFPYRSMNLVFGLDLARRQGRLAPAPDPRAYLAGAEPVSDWRQAIERMRLGHDFHRSALVERALTVAPPSGCSARITHFAAEEVALETDCPHPALLVLAEAWYPGWQVTVDGAPGECLPANAWMRAAPVAPGRHRVLFTFRPRALLPGAALSLLALAAVALTLRRSRAGQTVPLPR
jgi:hypothetical protein